MDIVPLKFRVRKRAGQHRAGGDYFPDDAPDDEQTWYADTIFGRYTAYETFAKPHKRFAVCPVFHLADGMLTTRAGIHKQKATSLDHAKELCEKHWQENCRMILTEISQKI